MTLSEAIKVMDDACPALCAAKAPNRLRGFCLESNYKYIVGTEYKSATFPIDCTVRSTGEILRSARHEITIVTNDFLRDDWEVVFKEKKP